MSLREDILALPDRPPTPVEVPEWDVTLYATFISAERQVEFAEAHKQYPSAPPRVMFAVFGIVDEKGEAVFSDLDIPALCRKPAGILRRLGDAVIDQDNAPVKNS